MNAVEVLRTARAAGVVVRLEGDGLALEAQSPPPATLLALIADHKADIVALLRPDDHRWSAEDWRTFFDERAAIMEFDGGLTRADAEARAFECCVVAWLDRRLAPTTPGRCVACGGGDRPHDVVLPFGSAPSGPAWLHAGCWPGWHAARRAAAVVALRRLGVAPPPGFPNDFDKNGRT